MRPWRAWRALRAMGPDSFPIGTRVLRVRRRPRWLTVAMVLWFVVSNVLNVVIGVLLAKGAFDGRWYDFRDLGVGMQQLREGLDDRFDPWVAYLATAGIAGVALLTFIGIALLLLVALVLLSAFGVPAARASVMLALDLAELVGLSDQIVVARAHGQQSRWHADGRLTNTIPESAEPRSPKVAHRGLVPRG